MSSPDVIVVGAGVLGLCTAAELAARGHAVTVIDPGGPNASSIAAGMLAPAMESVVEDLSPDHTALLMRARDLWPAFADTHGLTLIKDGAEWRGADADAVAARLSSLGFEASQTPLGVFTPDDWRIDPATAMTTLGRIADVTFVRARIDRLAGEGRRWRVEGEGGRVWFTPMVVLATGVAPPVEGLSPGVAALITAIQPIRGQLTVVNVEPPAHTIRATGLYVVPGSGVVLIGAGMDAGRRDIAPDDQEATRRVADGLALLGTSGQAGVSRVGIRGATADGLPLAGATDADGLHLALAPRRNGWLLGPLVARTVADGIEGRPSLDDAPALSPVRFG